MVKTRPDMPMIPQDLLRDVVQHKYATETSRWTSLRGGRTNRVWQIDTPNGAIVCKLFGQPDDNPLYPNRPADEYAALKYLSPHKIAPEPVALINTAAGEALIYRYFSGQLWRSDSGEVAALLSRLHQLEPTFPLRTVLSGSDALMQQIDNITATLRTRFPVPIPEIQPVRVDPISHPSIIHTDVVANNIIITKEGARLIDWQCPALGDPCEDIASFLSPAMQFLYLGKQLTEDQKTAFLTAYRNQKIVARYQKLAPLFHQRAMAYCYWKVERGSCDYRKAAELELLALKKFGRNSYQEGQNRANGDITSGAD